MKQVYGVWLPDNDKHFPIMMNEDGTYQLDTFLACMEYVKERKLFIDVGAHVGLWARMAEGAGFHEVHAFEPNPAVFGCLKLNMKGNAYNCGIGVVDKAVSINVQSEDNTGAVKIGEGDGAYIICLDSYGDNYGIFDDPLQEYGHQNALVKIDTEGSEVDCVSGMTKILTTLRPVVCVEQRSNKDAVKLLEEMGMEVVKEIRKDYILTWGGGNGTHKYKKRR